MHLGLTHVGGKRQEDVSWNRRNRGRKSVWSLIDIDRFKVRLENLSVGVDVLVHANLPEENPSDRSGDQVGHGTGEHGANSETSEVIAPFRYKGADTADLHAD